MLFSFRAGKKTVTFQTVAHFSPPPRTLPPQLNLSPAREVSPTTVRLNWEQQEFRPQKSQGNQEECRVVVSWTPVNILELKRNGFFNFREKRKFGDISFHEHFRFRKNFRKNLKFSRKY